MYRLAIALCVSLGIFLVPAFPAAIGVAVAKGSFLVDNNKVIANATLFEGSLLETGAASSELELAGGARMRLGAASRGRVYQDRLVVEKGLGELAGGSSYRLEALGLRILPDLPGSSGRIALTSERKVQALALSGSMRVTTADGTVVALLVPGKALEFAPQAVTGAQAPFQMTGCLERRQGRFVLHDPLTGVIEEVRGERLDNEVGRMLEVTATVIPGAEPISGALEVIQLSRMRRVAGDCVVAPAAEEVAKPAQAAKPAARPPSPSAPAPAKVAKPGMSGATKAVIAGVVVGGAGAGAFVYLKTQKNDNPGTISR